MKINLHSQRREYLSRSLKRKDLPQEPIDLLLSWLKEATEEGALEPTALIVATVGQDLRPSLRTVLLKEVDEEGRLVFYTNYESRKGQQIAENPAAACSLIWHEMERQIHLEGYIEKVSAEESDSYFSERPYTARIGARISPQSRPISSRGEIMKLFAAESLKYTGRRIPRPLHWGGYRLIPERIEFWQGRESRLHDRFLYEKNAEGSGEKGWKITRLAP